MAGAQELPHGEVRVSAATEASPSARAPRVHWPTLSAMLFEALLCAAVVLATLAYWHPLTVGLAMVVLATRQHAQFILFHDAVHFNVTKNRRLNDFITNLIIGIPQLVPVQLYRRLHLSHHAKLGSPGDTERVLLYRDQPWHYRPLGMRALVRQLLGDLLLLNAVRTLVHFGRERRNPRSLLELPRAHTWPEHYVCQLAFVGGLALWGVLDATSLARFALLWFVPLLTITQLIQKVRSFAEHAALDAPELSYSWRPGILGRLVLWPYGIHYHREHHIHPSVPWYRLKETFPDVEQREGRTLARLLWDGTW